ncbi:non-canonical purine NTP pyrophosphatase, RdgB/HAM1 family [Taibaiella sp. KBW10]|uniref:RdgB/HAM1 family non-canonical purine NTP pyrophosphatase n=1 Tax=Taibaiella sp. KBW10 TaxID=2153357 RepID=UPI000F5A144B|nr:RdgB/HAM1 family non-canonical purine NTP pyrophosphatase [Taibaiella sp. KBW10]RQO32122.1 non-canonical purine NTP pyrophosphatase, RdgB/HAM1 family [Taibaiella sp. KBW10]
MKIILASNNKHKIAEINELLDNRFEVISLTEAGITEDIPEPYDTFEENALAKAQYAFDKTGLITFSEDSGLVVPALKGAPGVFSARYAGEPRSDARNTAKLLQDLEGYAERDAYYQTTICLVSGAKPMYFKGTCAGTIAENVQGEGGFGYDPIFIPQGYDQTFGQLSPAVKKSISHRAKAMALFITYIQEGLS